MLFTLLALGIGFWIFYNYYLYLSDPLIMQDNSDQVDPGQAELPGILERLAGHVDSYRDTKIPKFFREDPQCWFFQVEASFADARIVTEATKAHSIIANLDTDLIPHIRDIITAVPRPIDQYTQIKNRLISAFSKSSETRLRQLLRGEVFAEAKPSLLLNRLRSLNDGVCSDQVLKAIFLDQLPSSIRAVLVMSDRDDLQFLADMADKVAEASRPLDFQSSSISSGAQAFQPVVAAVAGPAVSSDLSQRVDRLSQQLNRLMKEFRGPPPRKVRDRSRSASNFRNRRNRSRSRDSSLCFYHKRFGTKAVKCVQPCSWGASNVSEN